VQLFFPCLRIFLWSPKKKSNVEEKERIRKKRINGKGKLGI